MIRRVVEHAATSKDREKLKIITVYESGINKEQVKEMNQYTKKHGVLIQRSGKYEFK